MILVSSAADGSLNFEIFLHSKLQILYITAKTIQGFDDLAGSGIYGQVTQLENNICDINSLTVPGLQRYLIVSYYAPSRTIKIITTYTESYPGGWLV